MARRARLMACVLLARGASSLAGPQRGLAVAIAAEAVAGCVGGLCKAAAVYPLDVEATRREVVGGGRAFRAFSSVADHYRGLGVVALFAPLYSLLFHAAYVLAARAAAQVGVRGPACDLVGALAGSIAGCVVGVPAECARHRVQLGTRRDAALSGGWTLYDGTEPRLVIASGIHAQQCFWNERRHAIGLGATLARNVPYNACNFYSYGVLVGMLPAWLAGLCAGALTAVVTHPLDVVNTRIQTARVGKSDAAPPNVSEALRIILAAKDRRHILLRGLGPRMLSFAPASLIFFAVFEPVRRAALAALS